MSRPRTLGVITARGGSKRVPRKNLREVGGRSLIEWTCEAAKSCSAIDRLIVSTDDPEIAEACRLAGVEAPFLRPPKISGDHATSIEVLLHALDFFAGENFECVTLLQPTSPLRKTRHLDEAFRLFHSRTDAESLVSVFPSLYPPYLILESNKDGFVSKLFPSDIHRQRSQDAAPTSVLNGAIYISKTAALRRNQGFLGSKTLAYEMTYADSLDIDTEEDLAQAGRLLRGQS